MAPQGAGNCQRVNFVLVPPTPFITRSVVFSMVNGAERNGEFVAYFEGKPLWLRITDVVRMRWRAPTNETRLTGYELEMLFRTMALGFPKLKCALVDSVLRDG